MYSSIPGYNTYQGTYGTDEMERLTKMCVCEKIIIGAVRYFVEMEGNLSWGSLKATLIEEFNRSLNESWDAHSPISQSVRKPEESIL